MGKCEGREPLQKGKKRGTRMLEAGTEGYQELVVTMEDTALAAGSGGTAGAGHAGDVRAYGKGLLEKCRRAAWRRRGHGGNFAVRQACGGDAGGHEGVV